MLRRSAWCRKLQGRAWCRRLGSFAGGRLDPQQKCTTVVALVGESAPWADSALEDEVAVFKSFPDFTADLAGGIVGVPARLLGVMLQIMLVNAVEELMIPCSVDTSTMVTQEDKRVTNNLKNWTGLNPFDGVS